MHNISYFCSLDSVHFAITKNKRAGRRGRSVTQSPRRRRPFDQSRRSKFRECGYHFPTARRLVELTAAPWLAAVHSKWPPRAAFESLRGERLLFAFRGTRNTFTIFNVLKSNKPSIEMYEDFLWTDHIRFYKDKNVSTKFL